MEGRCVVDNGGRGDNGLEERTMALNWEMYYLGVCVVAAFPTLAGLCRAIDVSRRSPSDSHVVLDSFCTHCRINRVSYYLTRSLSALYFRISTRTILTLPSTATYSTTIVRLRARALKAHAAIPDLRPSLSDVDGQNDISTTALLLSPSVKSLIFTPPLLRTPSSLLGSLT